MLDLQIGTNATNGDRIAVTDTLNATVGTLRITESEPALTAAGTAYTLGTALNFIGGFPTVEKATGNFNVVLGPGVLTATPVSLTNKWINTSDGFWNTGSNWSRGISPTAAHDVWIDVVSHNPTVTASAGGAVANSLHLGDTLTLDTSLGVTGGMSVLNGGTFNHTNGASGTVTAGGNITIDAGGVMNWSGGTVGAALDTSQQFTNNGIINISGPGSSAQTTYLNWVNNGVVNWTGGRSTTLLNNASGVVSFTNTSSGQVNLNTVLTGTDDFINGGFGNIFNQGTITNASSASATTRLNVTQNALQNTGTIISNSGTLSIGTAGTLGADTGDYTVASGSTLALTSSRFLNAGASLEGAGQLKLVSGSMTVGAGVGLDVLTDGSVSLGAQLNLNTGVARTINTLNMGTGGVLFSGDAVTVGSLTASAGMFDGTGLFTTTGASTITGGFTRGQGLWVNSGTINLNSAGNLNIGTSGAGNKATLTNAATGVINLNSSAGTVIDYSDTDSLVNNQGTINQKSIGTRTIGNTTFGKFDNSGLVKVEQGALIVNKGTESGTYNVASGAILQLQGARSFTLLTSGAGLTGKGELRTGTAADITLTSGVNTSLLQNGSLSLQAGQFTINTGSGFTFANTVKMENGTTLNINNDMIGALDVGNGVINSTNGTTWQTPVGSTSTIAPTAGNTFSMANNVDWTNFGTINHSGAGTLLLGEGILNQGLIDLQGNGTLTSSGSSLNNTSAGTVRRSTSAGNFTINGAVAHAGTLNLQTGTLTASNAFINKGWITGVSTLSVGGAGLTNANNGTIAPGGVGAVGTLELAGTLTLAADSQLLIDATSAATYDKLNVTGSISSNAGANVIVSEITPFMTVGQNFDVLGYTTAFSGSLPIITPSGGVSFTSATTGSALRLSVAAVSNFWLDAATNNYSTATNWSRGYVPISSEDAVINPTNTQSITLSSGTQTPRSLQLTGDDTLTVNGGTLSLAQNSTVGSAASLALSSGKIDGAEDINIAGVFNWSGGILGGAGDLITSGVSTITNTATLQRNWNNAGVISLNSGASSLNLSNNADLTNTGTVNVNSLFTGNVISLGTGSDFSNAGIVNWNTGVSGSMSGAGNFQNTSTGAFNISGANTAVSLSATGFTQAGLIDIAAGSTLTRSAGIANAGTLTGGGTVNVGANSLTNDASGTIAPGGSGSIATLTIAGNADLTTGALLFDLGNSGASDRLVITGSAALGASLKLSEITAGAANFGDSFTLMTYASKTGTAALDNAAIADVTFTPSVGATSLVANVSAVTNRWNVDADGLWSTASNWSRGHTPTAMEDVVIDRASSQYTISLGNVNGQARTLTLSDDEILSLSNNKTLTLNSATAASSVGGLASLQLDSATLTSLGGTLTSSGTVFSQGISRIDAPFNNEGLVNITGGMLLLAGSGVDTNGDYQIDGRLSLMSGDRTLASGNSIFGAGVLEVEGANLLLSSAATGNFLTSGGGTLSMSSGTLAIAGNVTASRFEISGGTLESHSAPLTDQLTVTTSLVATGGKITSKLRTEGDSDVTGIVNLSGGQWDNSGYLQFIAGALSDAILMDNFAQFNNEASGTLYSNAMQLYAIFDGGGFGPSGGTVNNAGEIHLVDSSGGDRFINSYNFNNIAAGVVKLDGNARYVVNPATLQNVGTVSLIGGAQLSANSINNTGLIEGVGTLDVGSGTVTIASGGSIKPGDLNGTSALGTLTITGNLQLDQGSHIDFDLDPGNSDKIAVSGNITLNGASGPSFNFSEFTPNSFSGLESAQQ
ncbi:MAG: hypothetical protein HC765_08060 [Brachymonas sp.]|nr:hypothetical protein [Brachymonas sp.]